MIPSTPPEVIKSPQTELDENATPRINLNDYLNGVSSLMKRPPRVSNISIFDKKRAKGSL